MTIAERLLNLLQDKHLTAYQVSKDTGLNQSLIGKILNGETEKPRINTITTLASYLGVSVDWLYYGEGQERTLPEGELINYKDRLDALANKIEQAIDNFNTFQANASNNMANILSIVNAQKEIIASQQKTIELLSETIKGATGA